MKKLLYLFVLLISINGCNKDENPQPEQNPVVVTATTVTEITQTTATSGGNVTDDGGGLVTARGVCWSTKSNPTTADNTTNDDTGIGSFTSLLTGLTENTMYYVRAYATNSGGTAYGEEIEFTTNAIPTITAVEPLTAALGIETTFTVTGTNLPEGMGFWIADLKNLTEVTGGTTTTRYFKGTPSGTTETKEGVIKDVPDGNTLFSFQVAFKIPNFTGETITVTGGTFQMGSPSGSTSHSNEQPEHNVTLSNFKISKYEITNQQYADYMNAINANANGSVGGVEYLDMSNNNRIQISHNGSKFVVTAGKENYPVIAVSWYGAKAYSEYYGGRLPTEAEWEFASRGGNSSNGYPFSGSNVIDEVAWIKANSDNSTHPVGTKNANEIGLHDMSGNVWEWCNDWYDSDYYSNSPSNNPQGPSSGTERVYRGGSFGGNAFYCHFAFRAYDRSTYTSYVLGFRPVFAP